MSKLKPVDRMYLERLFEMNGGYVLSFSNNTFSDFVRGSTGEDIYSDAYGGQGGSKARRLREFWNKAPSEKVASLLGDLLSLMIDNEKVASDGPQAARVRGIIADLQGHAHASNDQVRPVTLQRSTERKAFISYSVERKDSGGAVKSCLSMFGYESFLAHEDLHVSEEWKLRILEELGTTDVFVALLSKEFLTSKWCGQELGFIVSRPEVLIVPLSLDGTMPYGFIEHLQGNKFDKSRLKAVLQDVLWRKRPHHMIPVHIERVRLATSFRDAEVEVLPLVKHFAQFTDSEAEDFAQAAAANSQVWDASLCRTEYIPEFVKLNRTRISTSAINALRKVLPELKSLLHRQA